VPAPQLRHHGNNMDAIEACSPRSGGRVETGKNGVVADFVAGLQGQPTLHLGRKNKECHPERRRITDSDSHERRAAAEGS